MLPVLNEEYNDVPDAVKYQPCVSVIIPFEPMVEHKSAIDRKLSSSMSIVKSELRKQYPGEKAMDVYQKLDVLVKNLNYNTHKKSIVIFVSPLVEKVYYLDSIVKEKIIIDEFLETKDLVYSKKEIDKYHLNKKAAHNF